jgi:GT2 family glycosyltransferase
MSDVPNFDDKLCVILATRGRPALIAPLLELLASQTRPPDHVFIMASEAADVPDLDRYASWVTTGFGPAGLATQRNRGLALAKGHFDYIVFFDDDFIPSRFWLERTAELFRRYGDLVCVTGALLADGARTRGIRSADGMALVAARDSQPLANAGIHPGFGPYGCNMAFRAKAVGDLTFDERLPLYAWLEDTDFGARVSRHGTSARVDGLWGVHLGMKSGRVKGEKLGYSQIANPIYLVRKKSISLRFAANLMGRNFLMNLLRSARPEPEIDRRGRLRGNLIALRDLFLADIRPERAAEL